MGRHSKEFFDNGERKEEERINKFIADAGICSRRAADEFIENGRVKINGEVAVNGSKVKQGDVVTLDGRVIEKDTHLVLIALNKPEGIVCTSDKTEPDNIIDFLKFGTRIFPIGRLDKDSNGLILLTNDGEIVNKILRAGNNHEKEYIVRVNKAINEEFVRGMSSGVPVLDEITKPCKVEPIDNNTFRITLTQGLNRQIRRMCEYFGYDVLELTRVRIMNIRLGRLKTGDWRNVTEEELRGLNELLKDSTNAAAADTDAAERKRMEEARARLGLKAVAAPQAPERKKRGTFSKDEVDYLHSKAKSYKEWRKTLSGNISTGAKNSANGKNAEGKNQGGKNAKGKNSGKKQDSKKVRPGYSPDSPFAAEGEAYDRNFARRNARAVLDQNMGGDVKNSKYDVKGKNPRGNRDAEFGYDEIKRQKQQRIQQKQPWLKMKKGNK